MNLLLMELSDQKISNSIIQQRKRSKYSKDHQSKSPRIRQQLQLVHLVVENLLLFNQLKDSMIQMGEQSNMEVKTSRTQIHKALSHIWLLFNKNQFCSLDLLKKILLMVLKHLPHRSSLMKPVDRLMHMISSMMLLFSQIAMKLLLEKKEQKYLVVKSKELLLLEP